MAELKQFKMKPVDDYVDTDPLAELTRIMGLAPTSAPTEEEFEDFGIDLERELLGEFGANDHQQVARFDPSFFTPANTPTRPEPVVDEDMLAHEFSLGFAQDDLSTGDDEPADARVAAFAPIHEPVADVAASHEHRDEDIDFFDEVESGMREEIQPSAYVAEPSPAEPMALDLEDELAALLDQHEAAGLDPAATTDLDSAVALDAIQDALDDSDDVPEEVFGNEAAHEDAAPIGFAEIEEARDLDASEFHNASDETYELEAVAEGPEDELVHAEPPVAVANWYEPKSDVPLPGDPLFDPFAELAAMASLSRPAASDVPAPAPVAVAAPVVAPVADKHPSKPAAEVVPLVKPSPPTRLWSVVNSVATAPASREPIRQQRAPDVSAANPVVAEAATPQPVAALVASRPAAQPAVEEDAPRASSTHDTWAAIAAWAKPALDGAARENAARGQPAAFEPSAQEEIEAYAPADAERVEDDGFDLDGLLESELAAGADEVLADEVFAQDVPAEEAFAEEVAVRGFADEDFGPDVDTVEVPEGRIEISDELDIPDLMFEDDLPRQSEPDDLDLEFANAFEELSGGQRADAARWQRQSTPPEPSRIDAYGYAAAPRAPVEARVAEPFIDPADFAEPAQAWRAGDPVQAYAEPAIADDAWLDDAYPRAASDGDPIASEFDDPASYAAASPSGTKSRGARRGLAIAALVAGVAIAGGVGTYMFAFDGGGGSAAPTLVKADPSPVKVRPETPGGVTVPNQDKAVYDRVAGAQKESAPTQQKLVSSKEQPVDIAAKTVRSATPTAVEGNAAAVGKSEDRVEQAVDGEAPAAEDVAAVAPRKVKTMVVKPDGTLVAREETAAPAPVDTASVAPAAITPPKKPQAAPSEPVEATAPAAPVEAKTPAPKPAAPAARPEAPKAAEAAALPADTAPVRVVESKTIKPADVAKQGVPVRGPVAPTRPADQPVEIVGSAGATAAAQKVAAVAPAAQPQAAAAGGWAMQIASQPSPEGAQASYADLSRRFGGVIGGLGVNIVKADIAGKGTFWRVRIPAGSRDEANALCGRYKAAGGSCFVSK